MQLTQSMSRRGYCPDNAPIESFFGHFKDDVDYKEASNLLEKEIERVESALIAMKAELKAFVDVNGPADTDVIWD